MTKDDQALMRKALHALQEWIYSYDGFSPPDSTQHQYCVVCGKADFYSHKDGCSGAALIAELTERLSK